MRVASLVIAAFLLTSLAMDPIFAAESGPAAKLVLSGKSPLVIAHRGNSSEAPENTIPAFASAVKLKTDFVELDYHHTADGIPLVIHDKILDRTTNAVKLWGGSKLAVARYSCEKLQTLDAGAWRDPKFAGTKLATLSEALDVIQAGSMTMIEHKSGDAKTLVTLLRDKKLTDRVIVQSFDWKFITDCHALEPTLLLGALGDKDITQEKLAEAQKTGAQVIGWNHKYVNAREIGWIHDRKLKSWVYTVDEESRAKELIAAGIDGIISNRPAAIMSLRK